MSPSNAPDAEWRLASRIAFRFAFAYFVLYYFPAPLHSIPGSSYVTSPYYALWDALVPWVGTHVLGLSTPINTTPNGSGDTTSGYVQLLCTGVLALAATLLWSLLDARRRQYTKLHDGLRTYLRYVLAVVLISYGLSKLFKLQFPFPSPERLLSSYGESSPMGLLWTFMGYSTSYNIFTGAAEFLGGLLLFFRRTTTLGALIVAGVMANVVMLNFSYDVPVKLFSTQLLLTAVFLLLPDLRRLANLLVLNRPTEAVVLRAPWQLAWLEKARPVVKYLFVGWALFSMTKGKLERYETESDDAPAPHLYGAYEVETFTRNGEELPPLLGDATRWRTVGFNRYGGMSVRRMNDTLTRLRLEEDPAKQTLTVSLRALPPEVPPSAEKYVLTYQRPSPDLLLLEGVFQNDTVSMRLKRVDTSRFLLVNRGFHWINEYPFNR